jgi:cell fate (sporulation/competence/biofilm development) regulator YmcA (YheA/YmcA/DUF963 family)
MTAQKRGLGRGLEALLVDVSKPVMTQDSLQRPSANIADEQTVIAAVTLMKAIQKENANLIKEVEALKELLEDFETLVRNLNIDKS